MENIISTYEPQACMVVYSIIDSESFRQAEEILHYLNTESAGNSRARILVGNKVDLERSRQVTAEEGKQLAHCYDAKFIETSAGLEHNVDELLVGVLKQILLRLDTERKTVGLKVQLVEYLIASDDLRVSTSHETNALQ